MPGNGKYTEELAEQIAGLVASGTPQKYAAIACGIHEITFYDWLERYPNFANLLKKKKSAAMHERIERIRQAGQKGQWTADAWYLERQHPEEFGLKQSQPDIAITVQVRDCTQDVKVQMVACDPAPKQITGTMVHNQGCDIPESEDE